MTGLSAFFVAANIAAGFLSTGFVGLGAAAPLRSDSGLNLLVVISDAAAATRVLEEVCDTVLDAIPVAVDATFAERVARTGAETV
jgi:hypothetical protein